MMLQLSLADAIKKPIVPLLLEKMTWPPEGPMSMVFTQLLYINFCKPDVGVQVRVTLFGVVTSLAKGGYVFGSVG